MPAVGDAERLLVATLKQEGVCKRRSGAREVAELSDLFQALARRPQLRLGCRSVARQQFDRSCIAAHLGQERELHSEVIRQRAALSDQIPSDFKAGLHSLEPRAREQGADLESGIRALRAAELLDPL